VPFAGKRQGRGASASSFFDPRKPTDARSFEEREFIAQG